MSSEQLKKTGLKVTPSRLTIFRLFETHKDRHLSAYDIQQLLQKAGSEISLATIYRVLAQFEAAALIQRHELDDEKALYELHDGHHHDHMVCNSCGMVFDFYNCDMNSVQQHIIQKHNFMVTSHRLILYGICADCSHTSEHKD